MTIKKHQIYLLTVIYILTIIAALITGEFFLRYKYKAYPFNYKPLDISYLTGKDRNLKWRYSNAGGRNSLGLKNKEITSKENNTYRILFIGDSLLWSGETSSGKLYTQEIESTLNRNKLQPILKAEVINAGIPGYTTYQELEFLKQYGLDMQPDMIVLCFVFNDVYYKYLHKPTKGAILGPNPDIRLHHFTPGTFAHKVLSRSYLANRLAFHLSRVFRQMAGMPVYQFERRGDFYLAWKEYGWSHTDRLIGEMKTILDARRTPLLCVIFPIREQVEKIKDGGNNKYLLYPQIRIESICFKYGIPYLNLTPLIVEAKERNVFKDYLHLNQRGNDIVANALPEFILTNIKNDMHPDSQPDFMKE